ncbi:MAG: hypothetical protein U1F48_13750 [Burkholderiales bacterium]
MYPVLHDPFTLDLPGSIPSPERLERIIDSTWLQVADLDGEIYDALCRKLVDSLAEAGPDWLALAIRNFDTVVDFLTRDEDERDLPAELRSSPGLNDRETLDVCEDAYYAWLRRGFPDAFDRRGMPRRSVDVALKRSDFSVIHFLRRFWKFSFKATLQRFGLEGPSARQLSVKSW